MKIVLSIIACVVAAVLGVYTWTMLHAAPAADPVVMATVAKASLTQSITSTGTVASNLDVPIKCRASGEVLLIGPKDRTKDFDVSDVVKTGDLLLQLDTSDELRPLQQAKVELDISNAKLEQAKQQLIVSQEQLVTNREKAISDLASAEAQQKDADAKAARRKDLLEQNLGTQEDYDTAADTAAQMAANVQNAKVAIEDLKTQEVALKVLEQGVKLADAQAKSDQISVDIAQQNLDYTTVTAPMDGVITQLTVQKGAIIVSATGNVSGGQQVMQLSDLSRVFILADVDEADVGGIQAGQDVKITADARPGLHFMGKVIRTDPYGVVISNVTTFEVKIEVTSANKALLWPLMSANIEIIEAQKDNVLTIPIMAVVGKGKKATVTVVKDGKNEERPVVVGINDGNDNEIISGLSEGEQVIVHRNQAASKWTQGQPRPGGPGH